MEGIATGKASVASDLRDYDNHIEDAAIGAVGSVASDLRDYDNEFGRGLAILFASVACGRLRQLDLICGSLIDVLSRLRATTTKLSTGKR